MNGYKKLMISVLAQAMTDYIQAIKIGGLGFTEKLKRNSTEMVKKLKKDSKAFLYRTPKEKCEIETMTKGQKAKIYIFENDEESETYVFGFKFICNYIGIDPEKFRKKIKEKREDFWRDIYIKIKEM